MTRWVVIFVTLLMAALASWEAQPYAENNSDLILVVTTVFTVFAGFLVAIITFLGDPSFVPSGSWRKIEGRRNLMEQRLTRHIVLFMMYLMTIALIFVSVIVAKIPNNTINPSVKIWIDRGYLFFGVFSFLLSFWLPFALHSFQMSRLDEETERRRKAENIE
jgi:hypothetical protein